jgi:hypothetical protein
MWLKAVGPEWFLSRCGYDWRPDGRPIKRKTVRAFLIQGNSLDQHGLSNRRREMAANCRPEDLPRAAQVGWLDGPYGRLKHVGSAVKANWDDRAFTGTEVGTVITASVDAGFLAPDHIIGICHEFERTAEYIEGTKKAGLRNHQTMVFQKAGQARQATWR